MIHKSGLIKIELEILKKMFFHEYLPADKFSSHHKGKQTYFGHGIDLNLWIAEERRKHLHCQTPSMHQKHARLILRAKIFLRVVHMGAILIFISERGGSDMPTIPYYPKDRNSRINKLTFMVPYIDKSFRINCIEFGSDLFDQAKIEQFTILFRSDVFIFLASIQT